MQFNTTVRSPSLQLERLTATRPKMTRIWREGDPCTLLAGLWTSTIWAHWASPNPKSNTTVCSSRRSEISPWRPLHSRVHCSTVRNSQEMGLTWMSIWRWVANKNVGHIQPPKGWHLVICNDNNGTGGCYVRWNKPRNARSCSHVKSGQLTLPKLRVKS